MAPEHDVSSQSLKRKRNATEEVKEKKDKKHKKIKEVEAATQDLDPITNRIDVSTAHQDIRLGETKPKKKKRSKDEVAATANGSGPKPGHVPVNLPTEQTKPKKKSKKEGVSFTNSSDPEPAPIPAEVSVDEPKSKKKSKKDKTTDLVGEKAGERNNGHIQTAEVKPEAQVAGDSKPKKSKKSKQQAANGEIGETSATTTKTVETASVEPTKDVAQGEDAATAGAKQRFIVFIGNLPYTATTESITAHFVKIRPDSVRHRTEKGSGKSKGTAFLELNTFDRMRTCLKLYHHSTFDDGKSAPRKINVELTVGGGGAKSGERKEKLRQKNERLGGQRQRRAELEEKARVKKEGKDGKDKGVTEKPEKEGAGAVAAERKNHEESGIHPARMAMINSLR